MEYTKIKTKNGGIYAQFEDMKPIKDSMQFCSGIKICRYSPPDGRVTVTIEVRGEVRITYKDEVYTNPSEFPQEVKEIIKNGDLWDTDEIYVGNNNWFELFFWDEEGNFLDSDVVDIEGMSPEELCDYCEEVLTNFRKDRGI